VVNQPPKTIVEIEPIDYLMPNTFVQVKFLGIINPEAIQIQVMNNFYETSLRLFYVVIYVPNSLT